MEGDWGMWISIFQHLPVPVVINAAQVSPHWNKIAMSDELWRAYLHANSLRPTFFGSGGLQGLYGNHVLYAASGLEGRLRHGTWNQRDNLTAPPTRGESSQKQAPILKEMIPYSISVPAPVSVVRCSGDQVAVLTERGDLFAWRADPDPEQCPSRALMVPGPASGRVRVLCEFGTAITEDNQLWCFCIDPSGVPVGHRVDGSSLAWQHFSSEKIVGFKARPGICAAVSTSGELYTWAPDHTAGKAYLGRPGGARCPLRVEILEEVEDVVLGTSQVAVLTQSGQVWVWGNGEYGSLGLGPKAFEANPESAHGYVELEPVLVSSLRGHKIVSLCGSGQCTHFAALTDKGEVWQWGGAYTMTMAHFHHPTCAAHSLEHKVVELCCVDECTVARSHDDMFIMHFPSQYRPDDKQKFLALPSIPSKDLPWAPLHVAAPLHPRLPMVAMGSLVWAVAGVYTERSRLWRMAVQSKVFEKAPQVEAGWQLAHQEVVKEREHGQWSRNVLLGKLRQLGLDVSNQVLIEKIATKYAGDMFSDPHDPEYLTRVADHLVHFQIYGDYDFEAEDDKLSGQQIRVPIDDDDDDDDMLGDDILNMASAHVSASSLRAASESVFRETGFRI